MSTATVGVDDAAKRGPAAAGGGAAGAGVEALAGVGALGVAGAAGCAAGFGVAAAAACDSDEGACAPGRGRATSSAAPRLPNMRYPALRFEMNGRKESLPLFETCVTFRRVIIPASLRMPSDVADAG